MGLKTTTLSVGELCRLNTELNTERGLLSERLPMVFKYHLSKVAKIASEEQEAVNKLRDESIRTLGTESSDGSFSIDQFIEIEKAGQTNNVPNPVYLNFVHEMEKLLKEERIVNHDEFFVTDLKDVTAEGGFPIFFKLLDA